jgi:hypothetical protein
MKKDKARRLAEILIGYDGTFNDDDRINRLANAIMRGLFSPASPKRKLQSSVNENDTFHEVMKEFKEENKKMSDEEKESIMVESDLYDLSNILRRLQKKGVDQDIIADTIINQSSYLQLSRLSSKIDGFLRSANY